MQRREERRKETNKISSPSSPPPSLFHPDSLMEETYCTTNQAWLDDRREKDRGKGGNWECVVVGRGKNRILQV